MKKRLVAVFLTLVLAFSSSISVFGGGGIPGKPLRVNIPPTPPIECYEE